MTIARFRNIVRDFYATRRRDLPWRLTRDPYAIMVSEIMLQQTQAERVAPRYLSFLRRFPTAARLARAKLAHVLSEWQGLGYNRRAMYLRQACEMIERDFGGDFGAALRSDAKIPGIGPYTRGAIRAFAFDEPQVFIETNIRSVFIHHFFPKNRAVSDAQLLPLIERSLDRAHPRDWYSALMDYGAHLKRTLPNPARKSRHHIKQSRFEGSNRQLRSYILREILRSPQTAAALRGKSRKPLIDIDRNLRAMTKEGLISESRGLFSIQ